MIGGMGNNIFLGLAYGAPHEARYCEIFVPRLPDARNALTPASKAPGGLPLDRITGLIARADRTAFDVSVANANVWFELGVAVASRRPLRLLTDADPDSRPDVRSGGSRGAKQGQRRRRCKYPEGAREGGQLALGVAG